MRFEGVTMSCLLLENKTVYYFFSHIFYNCIQINNHYPWVAFLYFQVSTVFPMNWICLLLLIGDLYKKILLFIPNFYEISFNYFIVSLNRIILSKFWDLINFHLQSFFCNSNFGFCLVDLIQLEAEFSCKPESMQHFCSCRLKITLFTIFEQINAHFNVVQFIYIG